MERSEWNETATASKAESILAAAKRMFLEGGFGAVSMDAIAREPGQHSAADVLAVRLRKKASKVRTALRDLVDRGIIVKPSGKYWLASDHEKQVES